MKPATARTPILITRATSTRVNGINWVFSFMLVFLNLLVPDAPTLYVTSALRFMHSRYLSLNLACDYHIRIPPRNGILDCHLGLSATVSLDDFRLQSTGRLMPPHIVEPAPPGVELHARMESD